MPFDGVTAGFAFADGADDMVGFAAVRALNDVRCFLVGRVGRGIVFLHDARRNVLWLVAVRFGFSHRSHSDGL